MADRVGQQLGNYRLLRLLGRGGFAEVYLGEHLRLGTQAAIKVLHTSLEDDDVEGFLREAKIVARLKHPHIVRVFDFDVENHTPFLVMDYLPNGNVRRSHPKGTLLPPQTIVSYVTQVASALQYAHDEKLIHRDIKPENMLLDRDDTLVLSDFGIALVAQSSRYQSAQEVAGTAAYMAPEQFQGRPRRASDQYALGVVVYEWLTGDRPFHGSFSEIASQHLFVPPPSLRGKVSTISPDVEQVILTALEKNPDKRFGSVQVFATALEQANQLISTHQVSLHTAVPFPHDPSLPDKTGATVLPTHLPQTANVDTPSGQSFQPTVVAKPSHTPDVLFPLTREPSTSIKSQSLRASQHYFSRRVVVIGLTGLAAVGIAGGSLVWLAHSQQPTAPSFPTTSPPAGTTLLIYHGHSGPIWAVAWSPDSTRIASGGGSWVENDDAVRVWDAASGQTLLTYTGHTGYVYSVPWSPDGKLIASGSNDKTVQVWDAANGGHVYTYRGHASGVSSVAWSPDGKLIASGSYDNTVQVWEVNGGHVYTYRGHTDWIPSVAWSPDGKRIASGSADKTVQVWDATNGGHVYTYRGHTDRVVSVIWSPDGKRIASASGVNAQVWDAANGGHVYTYRGPSGYVASVAWSPDGKRIASVSTNNTALDNIVLVWQAE